MSKDPQEPKAAARPQPRSPKEIQEALNKLSGEYDYYCGVTSQRALELAAEMDRQVAEKLGVARARVGVARKAYRWENVRIVTEYRSKIKALYWALGQGEL